MARARLLLSIALALSSVSCVRKPPADREAELRASIHEMVAMLEARRFGEFIDHSMAPADRAAFYPGLAPAERAKRFAPVAPRLIDKLRATDPLQPAWTGADAHFLLGDGTTELVLVRDRDRYVLRN